MAKLSEIAADMLAKVGSSNYAATRYSLNGGLTLILVRNGSNYRLSLRRPHVAPSPVEVVVVRKAFGIPADVEPETRQQRDWLNRETEVIYHFVDLIWRAEEPAHTEE